MEIVVIFVLAIIAFIPAGIARSKGRSFGKWWVYGFFLFIFALVHSILLKKEDHEANKKVDYVFKILVYIFIIIQLIILLITVIVIAKNTFGGRSNSNITNIDPYSPYVGKRPEYSFFMDIGLITTNTKDTKPNTVQVDIIFGYDLDDKIAQKELETRKNEIRNFIELYFSGKTGEELSPENETLIKSEIREMLNSRILDNAQIRTVMFNRLDVYEAD